MQVLTSQCDLMYRNNILTYLVSKNIYTKKIHLSLPLLHYIMQYSIYKWKLCQQEFCKFYPNIHHIPHLTLKLWNDAVRTFKYKWPYYGISYTSFKEHFENHKTSLWHRSHLTASDLSKYYWKLVDDGAMPTIKFSIAKCVKANTFINRCNLCISEKAFIITLDYLNMLNKRSEFTSKCQHINKQLLNRVKDDINDWLWCVFVFTVCFFVLVMKWLQLMYKWKGFYSKNFRWPKHVKEKVRIYIKVSTYK